MKIREIRTYVLDAALAEPFAYSQAWYERRGACLVEIVGEDGNSGWGEAFGAGAPDRADRVDYYKPLLIGEDALATERHWQAMYNRLRDHGQKGLAIEALSAVDMALWDLKGRHLGVSVHRLLGGAACATRSRPTPPGFYRKRHGDPLRYLVDEAQERIAAGFSAIKLKLGFGLIDDVRLCETVRRAVGPDIRIMVDANHAYDAVGAIALGNRRIEDLNIGWFEEPVPPEDLAGYREVKAALGPSTIAGRRSRVPTRWGFRRAAVLSGWSTSCSRISPRPAGSPKPRRSPTWRMRSAYASIRMSGAPGSRWPPRCS